MRAGNVSLLRRMRKTLWGESWFNRYHTWGEEGELVEWNDVISGQLIFSHSNAASY